jgi:excisionase family DNA binding protein
MTIAYVAAQLAAADLIRGPVHGEDQCYRYLQYDGMDCKELMRDAVSIVDAAIQKDGDGPFMIASAGEEEGYVGIVELRRQLDVSTQTIHKWAREKKIPAYRMGRGPWKFKISEVKSALLKNQN